MEIDILTKSELESVKNELIQIIKESSLYKVDNKAKLWLRTSDVRKILGISNSSIQNLRTKGILRFSKVGGSIFYKAEDIDKLMESNIKSQL